MEQLKVKNNHLMSKRNEMLHSVRSLKSVEISSNISLLTIRNMAYPPTSSLVVQTESGPDKSLCYEFICNNISNVLNFFGEDWNAELIYDTAESIYADYYYLTFADWKLIKQRLKSSYYGKVYGKFTPAVLMDWISQYAGEWTQCSIDISLSGHDAHKPIIDSREQRQRDAELISINTMAHKLLNQ